MDFYQRHEKKNVLRKNRIKILILVIKIFFLAAKKECSRFLIPLMDFPQNEITLF